MKRKLIFIMVVALTTWGIRAALNPHITELDLNIDGVVDYDEFFEPSPSITPKGPGGFVCSNGWKMITLKAVGVNDPMKTRLNWNSARIEVWTATNGGTQVLSPTNYSPASSMPTQLWVKGVSVSATGPTKDASGNWTNCGPEHITLEAINNGADPTTPGTYYDRVAFTVVAVTFQAGTGTNTQAITELTALLDRDANIEAVVSPASAGGYIAYSITDTAKATVSPPTGTTSPQALTVHGVSTSSVPTTLNAMVAGSVCGSLPVTVDKEKWILSYCIGYTGAGAAGGGGASGLSAMATLSSSTSGTASVPDTFSDTTSGTVITVPAYTNCGFKYRAGGAWYLTMFGFVPDVTWSGACEKEEVSNYSLATNSWDTAGTYTVTATRTWYALWFFSVTSTSETLTVNVVKVDRLEYKWGSMAWTAVAATNYVPAGTNVQFKAYPAVTGTTWPAGKPVWANAAPSAIDASESSNTFASTGFADVTTECGNVVTAKMCALAMDIEQAVTNVHARMTNATLNLTAASYDGGGGVTWTSSPAGLSVVGYTASTFTFNPSNSTPTNYAVRATATDCTNCYDVCVVTVLKVDIVQTGEWACALCSTNFQFTLTPDSTTNVTWTIQPDLGTNGALFASGHAVPGTSNTATGASIWIDPGNTRTNYTITAYANQLTNCSDTAILTAKKPTRGYKYAYAVKADTDLVGVSAIIETRYGQLYGEPKHKCYAHHVVYASVGSDLSTGTKWAQTGWGSERNNGSTNVVKYRYAETKGDAYSVNYDTANAPAEGSTHTYACELIPATGRWEFRFDGTNWQQYVDGYWTNHMGNVIQYNGEIFNREDDMPGTSADKFRFQQCQRKTNGGSFTNANLTAGDVLTDDATEWGASHIDGTTFEIWDVKPGQW